MCLKTCFVCGNAANVLCGICSSASYRSSECRDNDHPLRDLFCQKLCRFFVEHPRPKETLQSTHYLALMFPQSSLEPELLWIATEDAVSEAGYAASDLTEDLVKCFPGPPKPTRFWICLPKLELWKGDNSATKSKANLCLTKVLNGFESQQASSASPSQLGWAGSIIIVGMNLLPEDHSRTDHPAFLEQKSFSTITRKMGIALLFTKCDIDPTWKEKGREELGFDTFKNREALTLLRNVKCVEESEEQTRAEQNL
ncbi:uncharacterized protein PAC_19938 [Phialocephala subalpina]|uniref:Suppressor of anucleate metulae protein B n=1 Tax=Phialocephala subalpina TaxID=576137 RepID=A0A1L7XYE0_9HELO|nr:uncharacterized protein PAC_19938 [Phialocephala subalpina]